MQITCDQSFCSVLFLNWPLDVEFADKLREDIQEKNSITKGGASSLQNMRKIRNI